MDRVTATAIGVCAAASGMLAMRWGAQIGDAFLVAAIVVSGLTSNSYYPPEE